MKQRLEFFTCYLEGDQLRKSLIIIFAILSSFLFSFWFVQSQHRAQSLSENQRERGVSDAMGALDFWTRARAYPDNDIPPDKYYRSYVTSKSLFKKLAQARSLAASDSAWTSIGPLSSSYSGNQISSDSRGRTLSVAVNPLNSSTLYCGSASGGLWRSHTSGLSGDWQRIELGFPALGISAISIDPIDTNIIYIGTGEVYGYKTALGGLNVRTTRGSYGIGILKSTDNGISWAKSLDWTYNQERGIQEIKMNPLNHKTLFAATTEGLYRTRDAGMTWTQVQTVLMTTDILFNGSDTTKMLAACGNFNSTDYGIYRSTDAGSNWTRIADAVSEYSGKARLESFGANNNIVFASVADSTTGVGALYKSSDFGITWTLLHSYPVNSSLFQVQGWYSHFIAVHPTDVNQIVHASVNMVKSTDGGSSFFDASGYYSDNHNYAHDPLNPNVLYVVCDNGIYRSTDFGTNFNDVGAGILTLQFYNGFSCSSTDVNVALGQVQDHIPGFLFAGSSAWRRPSGTDEVGWTAIDQTNDYEMYVLQRYGGALYKSTNRGASFSSVAGFSQGGFNSPFVVSPSSPNVIYTGTVNIYKSTNAGSTFSTLSGGLPGDGTPALSMGIASNDPNIVFVGYVPNVTAGLRIFRTSDGGNTWVNVTGGMPNRYPLDISINPKNSRTVYAVFGGFGSGHIFKSFDRGDNWADISGSLPNVPTGAVLVDPIDTNNVYVGNDIGVYVSTNGGNSWADFSDGLPEAVIVSDLTVSLSARLLRAATHGSGVYERQLAPANIFDYQARSLQSPSDGEVVAVGSTISSISATFKDIGLQTPTDSFNTVYRIKRGATEFFSDTQRVEGLGYGEVKQVTFQGSFSPPDTGMYTLEAISLAADQYSNNDTIIGTLRAVTPGPITYSMINKQSCSYSDIIGGTLAAPGDDNQTVVALPFAFQFDGHQYDSVQISTNGWLEFGTGSRGSQFGISTSAQLSSAAANGTLFTTARPTKALGVWWEDLNVDGSASLSYQTTGTTPNRTFTVQWKNVLAYHVNSTTRINFQAELFEGSNLIEYHYGPVVAGTFPSGPDVGAMRGLKDYVGGDFHYYDMVLGRSGSVNEGISTLTPLANWPGPDSCFRLAVGQSVPVVSLTGRWNLISVPVGRTDNTVAAIFPTAIQGTTYEYNGAYLQRDTLVPGKGYWTKFPSSSSMPLSGTPMTDLMISLVQGWNLIGSVDHDVLAPSGGNISSNVYEYANGYRATTVIHPGKGYWVKASSPGSVLLGPLENPPLTSNNFDAFDVIEVRDKSGNSQSLYITENVSGRDVLDSFELPPTPPSGGFDVRFASQHILEAYPQDLKQAIEFIVSVSSADYPLQITRDIINRKEIKLIIEEVSAGKIIASHVLEKNQPVIINRPGENIFLLKIERDASLPTTYALRQNYPNPFNPITKISFDVPENIFLSLKVYDLNGREVMKLAEGLFAQGSYAVNADFSSFASGVYFYRLQAGNFSSLKKMVFIK